MKLMNYALQKTYKEDVQNNITNQQISMDIMKNLNNGSVNLPIRRLFCKKQLVNI